LVGWAKVELEPGATRQVCVVLDLMAASRPLSYWNVDTHDWEVAHGNYEVYVGASSRDIRLSASLRI
jgi:beta-glucosidase